MRLGNSRSLTHRPAATGVRPGSRLPGPPRPAAVLPFLVLLLVAAAATGTAQPPPGYYDSVDTTNKDILRETLHPIIEDHDRIGWDTVPPNSWEVLEKAEADPDDPESYVLDIYKNARLPRVDSDRQYQREHSWPSSYGFPEIKEDAKGNRLPRGVYSYPHTDYHAIFLASGDYNLGRLNRPYAFCLPCEGESCKIESLQTVQNYDRGGDTGDLYPGWANWRTRSPDGRGIWETWRGRRGDVARAQLYMDVRYEGGQNSAGEWEPDLQLIDELDTIKDSSDGEVNKEVGYMGLLSDLLLWHFEDPPDTIEIDRHEVVARAEYQGNRNPFVDNPGWAYCLHLDTCSADLWVTKSDGVVEVVPGETLTYRIEAGSAHAMMGVVVQDVLDPAQLDVAAATWTCAPAAGAQPGTYCPGSGTGAELGAGVRVILEPGDSVVFTVTAPLLASASGTLVNTATVAPPGGLSDPAPEDNAASDSNRVLADGACGEPESWDVSGRTVDTARTFAACTRITAGDFAVTGSGDVTFRAGERIVLGDGFRVESGGRFAAEIDPVL